MTSVQNAATLPEHMPTDVSSTRRQQSRYRFDADHARLRPISASVHQRCWPVSHTCTATRLPNLV